jgi:hypothetical protein
MTIKGGETNNRNCSTGQPWDKPGHDEKRDDDPREPAESAATNVNRTAMPPASAVLSERPKREAQPISRILVW